MASPLLWLPYGEDALVRLAELVIARHAAELPKLSHVTILLASTQHSQRLRHLLWEKAAARGHQAILPPSIDSLGTWIQRRAASPHVTLSPHQQELLLVEALIEHPYLYGEGSPWALADSLLELFDEMAGRQIQLPANLEDFLAQLATAYGLPGQDNRGLFGEAQLVHTLWHAWHTQLQASRIHDRQTSYLLKLTASLSTLGAEEHIYLAGYNTLSPAECHWLQTLFLRSQATLLLQGASCPATDVVYHPDAPTARLMAALVQQPQTPEPIDDYGQVLTRIFTSDPQPLRERALDLRQQYPDSPLVGRLQVFAAGSAETEAQAVDLQTRRWLLAGKRGIGIVTENRRLARRVRALLERAGITLQDTAGWALSTTSAAAVLERWLQCVEEDFAHQPLLDLLKSPFVFPDWERQDLLNKVYWFEQGVVLKDQIARGLQRYREHLRYRQHRLPAEMAADMEAFHGLLDRLAQAAAPLEHLLDAKPQPPGLYLQALQQSLEFLGLQQSLAQDAAGQRVLEELQQLAAAVPNTSLRMSWMEFRAWLGRTLERFNFQPPGQTGPVQLMSLAQSPLCRFDALIIAGAEQEYLPGKPAGSAFFNDGVRATLELATQPERMAQRYQQFRALLETADLILITHRSEQDGEEIARSPWLERIQAMHRIAYDDDLADRELGQFLACGSAVQVTRPHLPLPTRTLPQPTTPVPPVLLPQTLSASGYQQLMNCPYQFFAARCLGLEPAETIREELEKSDYGERVHLCLQAFHSDVPHLPGPFREPLNETNKPRALACLQDIAAAVFSKDLEDNFLHRGWLKRWTDLIPHYLDWQLGHGQDWRLYASEEKLSTSLPGTSLHLTGRLDRIDKGEAGLGIIDYKTGAVPKVADVASLEAVQLPFYALLAEGEWDDRITRCEYLSLDAQQVKSLVAVEHEELAELKEQNQTRLQELWHALTAGVAVTAWGDEDVCQRCDMSGLCRRQVWDQELEG